MAKIIIPLIIIIVLGFVIFITIPFINSYYLTTIYIDKLDIKSIINCTKNDPCSKKDIQFIKINGEVFGILKQDSYNKYYNGKCETFDLLRFEKYGNKIIFISWEDTIWSSCGSADNNVKIFVILNFYKHNLF